MDIFSKFEDEKFVRKFFGRNGETHKIDSWTRWFPLPPVLASAIFSATF
jgi:hypothetical protein